jgi:hypothetical protein
MAEQTFLAKGDIVIFTYAGEVRKGVVESYKPNRHGMYILTIKDENRGGAFRSFQRPGCNGLVNLSKVPD